MVPTQKISKMEIEIICKMDNNEQRKKKQIIRKVLMKILQNDGKWKCNKHDK